MVLSIKEKELTVSVGGHEVFKDSYKVSIGDFVGIRYRFLGAGQVSNITVKDHNDTLILGQKNIN